MLYYKGYIGIIDINENDHLFYGRLVNIEGKAGFVGRTPEEIRDAFRTAVDGYIIRDEKG